MEVRPAVLWMPAARSRLGRIRNLGNSETPPTKVDSFLPRLSGEDQRLRWRSRRFGIHFANQNLCHTCVAMLVCSGRSSVQGGVTIWRRPDVLIFKVLPTFPSHNLFSLPHQTSTIYDHFILLRLRLLIFHSLIFFHHPAWRRLTVLPRLKEKLPSKTTISIVCQYAVRSLST